MRAPKSLAWLLPCLLIGVWGCGHYTIVFEVEEVINTDAGDPTNDNSRELLEVDLVCLTPEDSEAYPGIVNGTMRADEWFHARDKDDARIGKISDKRIYALRRGAPDAKRDTKLGDALPSGMDRPGQPREFSYQIRHAQALDKGAKLVIYGRFHAGTSVAKAAPLIIDPPGWDKTVRVQVGRTNMKLAGTE